MTGVDCAEVGFGLRHLRLRLEREEVRDGNGGQDADDRDDDHQFDQGEPLLAAQFPQHALSPPFRSGTSVLLPSLSQGAGQNFSPTKGERHSIPCFCNRYRIDRKEIFNNFEASVRFPPVFSRAFSRWIFSRRSISVSRKTPSSG